MSFSLLFFRVFLQAVLPQEFAGPGSDKLLAGAELRGATEAASALLDELGLGAYLFAIEPREDAWELKVECAVAEGWQMITLPVDIRLLLASRTNRDARARLAQNWGARLSACRRSAGPRR